MDIRLRIISESTRKGNRIYRLRRIVRGYMKMLKITLCEDALSYFVVTASVGGWSGFMDGERDDGRSNPFWIKRVKYAL